MEWLWGSTCAGCGVEGVGRLCAACRGAPVGRLPAPGPQLAGAFVLARYATPLGDAVRLAKVTRDRHLAGEVAALFARRVAPCVADGGFTAVLAAPSTAASLLRRGFSLAAVLAHALAAEAGLPTAGSLRRRGGRRQATLGRAERRLNLHGRVLAPPVSGRVLLVDDVVTTGATALACADALRRAGASEVWLAVVVAAVDEPLPALPPAQPTGSSGRRGTRLSTTASTGGVTSVVTTTITTIAP